MFDKVIYRTSSRLFSQNLATYTLTYIIYTYIYIEIYKHIKIYIHIYIHMWKEIFVSAYKTKEGDNTSKMQAQQSTPTICDFQYTFIQSIRAGRI